ncbi:HSP70/90 co-chaperone [Diatrype stigma]|uniref:HSP70/90 co-chaperone n=1 Tax=Diatrype stigma TaxID=117547 RepID=A0AAN9UWI7_9PEZI
MHIEEITDDVAERLKLATTDGSSQANSSPAPTNASTNTNTKEAEAQNPIEQDGAANTAASAASAATSTTAPPVVLPELSPGRAMESNKTVDEVVADLKKSPFFMTELEENDETEAFKALAYEGTPSEVAADFKDRGNECFQARRWADAKEFYTKGILVLAAEERKRQRGEPTTPDHHEGGENENEPESDEAVARRQRAILEPLYANRAACHLELRNYRSCWLDGFAALRLNDRNVKAYYRSARALLAAGRIAEADDACASGLAVAPDNGPLRAAARDIIAASEKAAARQRAEAERVAREKRRALLLRAALKARGIRTRATAQPPEMEDAGIRLAPDPDDPRGSALTFPAVLLYPLHLQSDFVKAFAETDAVADHLAYVLPLPWDRAGEYGGPGGGAVECYAETVDGGLLKVGKKAPLLKLLASGRVEVVDEVVRLFVLPKARAEAWVREFKEKRAAERGGR